MIRAAIRITADWLMDATHGVNAKIATLSALGLLDTGDTAPPTFPEGHILDETRNGVVARGSIPELDPVLTINAVQSVDLPGEIMTVAGIRDADAIEIMIRYARKKGNTEAAVRDFYYVQRSLLRSIRVLMSVTGDSARLRTLVKVSMMPRVRALAIYSEVGNIQVVGGLILTFHCRDLLP